LGDTIGPRDLHRRQETGAPPLIIDVRGPEEYEAGHVPRAVNIPLGELAERLEEMQEGRLAVPY
jgi:rhodanese-related sulfurtransferase